MIERRIAAAGARSLKKREVHQKYERWRKGGGGPVRKRAPPSPSARKKVRDGTGEAPTLVFLHCVPGASIRSLPGIALLCGGARAASVKRESVMAQEKWHWVSHILGLLLGLFVGAGAIFALCFTSACCEMTLVKRV